MHILSFHISSLPARQWSDLRYLALASFSHSKRLSGIESPRSIYFLTLPGFANSTERNHRGRASSRSTKVVKGKRVPLSLASLMIPRGQTPPTKFPPFVISLTHGFFFLLKRLFVLKARRRPVKRRSGSSLSPASNRSARVAAGARQLKEHWTDDVAVQGVGTASGRQPEPDGEQELEDKVEGCTNSEKAKVVQLRWTTISGGSRRSVG